VHPAVRVLGWSLFFMALVGVLWPERPQLPAFGDAGFPVQAASYEAPPPPHGPPAGGCPTPTCAAAAALSPLQGLTGLQR